MTSLHPTLRLAFALAVAAAFTGAQAQEAAIRKNLAERLPTLPKIEEVSKTPMNGLYEVRINQSDIFYSDAKGDFILLQGELIDTRTRANLTEERVNKLTAIAFDQLPLKDAFTTVRGNGKNKIAVFSDPNCGFCKRLERDLIKLNDVTVYTFLIPILGADSQTKARNIWCAKDKAASYNEWMLNGATPANASCDTAALTRNLEFAGRMRITGTPTSFLADGTRIQGADFKKIEQMLAAAK
ncbi:DsbC family protein [Hydrogenophaga aquatica]